MSDPQQSSEQDAATDHLSQVFQHMAISGHARVHMGNVFHSTPRPPPTPRLVIPFSRDPNFVGREDLLTRMFETLKTYEDAHHRMVVQGLGGIGKSQIAIEFAYRYREKHPDHWVFWIYAASQERYIDAFKDIAQQAAQSTDDLCKSELLKAVRRWLSSNEAGRWLLIVDNADDQDVVGRSELATERLSDYLPQSHNGNILITTRNDVGASLCDITAPVEAVNPLSMNSAWKLLERLDPSTESRKQVEPLLRKIDCIPLAIRQAAAYICQTKVSLAEYIMFLDAIDDEAALWSREWQDFRRQSEQNAVFLTWNVSFNQMRDHHPDALELLTTMIVLDEFSVPENLFRNSTTKRAQHEAVGQLFAFSLVRRDETDRSLRMHRLVRECIQAWIKKENIYGNCLHKASLFVMSLMRERRKDTGPRELQDLISHAFPVISSYTTHLGSGSIEIPREHVTNMLGVLLRHDALLATERLEQILPLCNNHLGASHEHTLQGRVLLCRREYEDDKLDLAEERARMLDQDLTQESSKFGVLAMVQVQVLLGHIHSTRGRDDAAYACYSHACALWQKEAVEGLELPDNAIVSVRELVDVLRQKLHDDQRETLLELLIRRMCEISNVMAMIECSGKLGLMRRHTEGNLTALKWLQYARKLLQPRGLCSDTPRA